MQEQRILCPKCGEKIEIAAAFSHEIEEGLRKEFNQKYALERSKLEDQLRKKTEQEHILQIQDLKNQLTEASGKLNKFREDELEILKRRRELEAREKELNLEVEQKFDTLRKNHENTIKQQVEQQVSTKLHDLENQLSEKASRLQLAEANELETRKRLREIEERERTVQLEIERMIEDERKKIWENATTKLADEYRFKEAEKESQLNDMRRQIDDLKRKAEQTSRQLQGEVFEVELENLLRYNFKYDEIQPVPKGVRGADAIQFVHTLKGEPCGSIIWESKRTKHWQDIWIQKLKDNQRECKANFGIIVSTALPKEINRIGMVDGIWVIDFSCAIGLGMALRTGLIELAQTKIAMVGKNQKIDIIYNYFTNQEFRQRVEAIVEAFSSMKEDLDKEKRSIMTLWAKREKQIERVLQSTTGLYGDLQNIIGSSLQPIPMLELPVGKENLYLVPNEGELFLGRDTDALAEVNETIPPPNDNDISLPY